MSIPKEPRQMMINMMYLVLTALLAMNVSAEILNAFHVVHEGIAHSNTGLDEKNAATMVAFADQMKKDPEKTKDRYAAAQQAQTIVENLTKEIQADMDKIVKGSGGWIDKTGKAHIGDDSKGWAPEKGDLSDDKNLEVATHFMEEGDAAKLKNKILDARAKLLALITDPAEKKTLETQLPIRIDLPAKNSEGELKTWEEANFHMVPTIACLTLMAKFQNDAKNSESQIIDYFFGDIYKNVIKVDQMIAKVIAPSSYIMAGQQYKADIFVAAYSNSLKPKVLIGALNSDAKKDPTTQEYGKLKTNPVVGGGKELETVGGMGKYEVGASGEGEQKYSGAVVVPDPDGTPAYYPFDASYTSAKGSAIVSSDNLNIIYAGIPNPFSVSVPGFDASKVTASSTGGSFTGAKGKYTANMPPTMIGQKIKINVQVKTDDNKTTSLPGAEFVVKRIPDPVAKVAGLSEGRVKTGSLKASPGPIATLQDFYFQGVTFTVTSYDFIYIAKRADPYIKPNVGLAWGPDVRAKIDAAKPGDQIIIRSIKAKGPDGSTRSLNPISLEIN